MMRFQLFHNRQITSLIIISVAEIKCANDKCQRKRLDVIVVQIIWLLSYLFMYWLNSLWHTVWKSQIVSKNSIFGKNSKIVNLNFCAKNEWIHCDYDKLISVRIWIFTPKMVKIQHFQILLILYLHKITIFGAKNQFIQVKLAFKTFQKPFLF